MNLKPGSVILIESRFLPGIDHDKFALCLTDCLCFYFFVNTKPWRKAMDAQVTIIGKLELSCLDHVSYIDTSKVHELSPGVAHTAQNNGKVWTLNSAALDRVKNAVKNSRHLTRRQIKMIMQHL